MPPAFESPETRSATIRAAAEADVLDFDDERSRQRMSNVEGSGRDGYDALVEGVLAAIGRSKGALAIPLVVRRFQAATLLIGGREAGERAIARLSDPDASVRGLAVVAISYLAWLQPHLAPPPFGHGAVKQIGRHLGSASEEFGRAGGRLLMLAASDLGSPSIGDHFRATGIDGDAKSGARADLTVEVVRDIARTLARARTAPDTPTISPTVAASEGGVLAYAMLVEPAFTSPDDGVAETARRFVEGKGYVGFAWALVSASRALADGQRPDPLDTRQFTRRLSEIAVGAGVDTACRVALGQLDDPDVGRRRMALLTILVLANLARRGGIAPLPAAVTTELERRLDNGRETRFGSVGALAAAMAASDLGSKRGAALLEEAKQIDPTLDLPSWLPDTYVRVVAGISRDVRPPTSGALPAPTDRQRRSLDQATAEAFVTAFRRIGWLGQAAVEKHRYDDLLRLLGSMSLTQSHATILKEPLLFLVEVAGNHELRPSKVTLNGSTIITSGAFMSTGEWLIACRWPSDVWVWHHSDLIAWQLRQGHKVLDLDFADERLSFELTTVREPGSGLQILNLLVAAFSSDPADRIIANYNASQARLQRAFASMEAAERQKEFATVISAFLDSLCGLAYPLESQGPASGSRAPRSIDSGAAATAEHRLAARVVVEPEQDPGWWLARGIKAADAGQSLEALANFDQALRISGPDALILRHRGLELLRLGRHGEALRDLNGSLRVNPSDPMTLNYQGMALRWLGRLPEAVAAFEEAASLDPTNVAIRLHYSSILLEDSRPQEALLASEEALRLDPTSVDAHVTSSRALSAVGRVGDAIGLLEQAARRFPNNAQVNTALAVEFLTAGRLAEALVAFEQAVRLSPDADSLYGVGSCLALLGRDDEAAQAYGRAAVMGKVDALDEQAYALSRLGRHEECVSACRQAQAIGPLGRQMTGVLMASLMALGRFQETIGVCDEAVARGQTDSDLLRYRAWALRSLDRNAEALATYDRALARDASNPYLTYGRAMTLYQMGRRAEAISGFERTRRLQPEDAALLADALIGRGQCFQDDGDNEGAVALYLESLSVDWRPEIERACAILLAILGRPEEALDHYDRALAAQPDQVDLVTYRIYTLVNLHRFPAALESVNQALATFATTPGLLYGRACALAGLGRLHESLEVLSQSVTLDPQLVGDARSEEVFAAIRSDSVLGREFTRLVAGG